MVFTERERPVEKVRAFSKSVPATAARSEPVAPVFNKEEAMEETAKLVVVAWVVVAFEAVKFWRVVEPTTSKSPEVLMVVVAVPPILN